MFLQFYLFALLKIALLLALPPYLVGMAAGWKRKKDADRIARFGAIGYVVLIELVVLVEKGTPFFFSNLYYMFALSPVVWLQVLIGVGGLVFWLSLAMRQAKSGVALVKTRRAQAGKAA